MSCLLSSADAVVSPGDVQRFPVDKTRCDLAPCAFVNLLHGRAGNVHLRGTLLVGLLLQVNQPNDLVFVQRQQDRLGILAPVWAEGINLWYATNPTAPWRSWHRYVPFVYGIYRLYSIFRELSIRSERFTTSEFEGHSSVGVDGYRAFSFISGVQLSALERSFHRLAISEPSSMQYTTTLFFPALIAVILLLTISLSMLPSPSTSQVRTSSVSSGIRLAAPRTRLIMPSGRAFRAGIYSPKHEIFLHEFENYLVFRRDL